jgi:eukaryotic-like serine/threonine-protein kinase
MKLIKGRTLHDLLHERPDLAHDRAHFVAVFEQLCHAVGYAHSRGVVHHDLKPGNVMVGAFGGVQVMDWGLGNVVGAPEPRVDSMAAGTSIRTVRELGGETQAGSVLGSPAFMPPEQAGGEVGKIDPWSDVVGLGAVLCVIRTGEPPYTGDAATIHLKAIRAQLDETVTRLDTCGAESELVALCKWCLSADRNQRSRAPAKSGY